jgi:hypothetical protein
LAKDTVKWTWALAFQRVIQFLFRPSSNNA